jgi:hypothetical protein
MRKAGVRTRKLFDIDNEQIMKVNLSFHKNKTHETCFIYCVGWQNIYDKKGRKEKGIF